AYPPRTASWRGRGVKYLPLIWTALWRRRARTVLTFLSILVAFALFGLLDTVRSTFRDTGKTVREMVVVTPKTGMGTKSLPYSLLPRIKEVAGVVWIDFASYVEGTYRNPRNSILVEAHPGSWYESSRDIQISPGARLALRHNRAGVLAGELLAQRH